MGATLLQQGIFSNMFEPPLADPAKTTKLFILSAVYKSLSTVPCMAKRQYMIPGRKNFTRHDFSVFVIFHGCVIILRKKE